jgi:hypothetical protein
MPELIYPTRVAIGAPILISATSLKELDELLDGQLPALLKAQDELIPTRVEERLERIVGGLGYSDERLDKKRKEYEKDIREELFGRDRRVLHIRLSDGRRLDARSFEEAAAHPEVQRSVASGFVLEVRCGIVSVALEARSRFLTELTLDVSPSNYEPARNLYSSLERWVRSVEAPTWQRWWSRLSWGSFSFFMWAFIASLVWGASVDSGTKQHYKEEAHKLIEQGVTPDKQQKALETILALESDYSKPISYSPGRWFWFFLITGTMATAILAYPPKLELGIGRGEARVERWQRWMKFVFIAIPAFVASNFVWPWLSDVIRKYVMR